MQRCHELRTRLGYLLVAALISTLSACGTALPKPTPAADAVSVGGYRIELVLESDAVYGPAPSAAWQRSALPGLGARCRWERVGEAITTAWFVWGGRQLSELSGYTPTQTGTHAEREGGLPDDAVTDSTTATVYCGARDANGFHLAALRFTFHRAGDHTDVLSENLEGIERAE